MKKRNITIAFLGLSFGVLSAQSLKSPDGKFEMNFKLENGVPYYSLSYEGNPVLEPSKLGFEVFKKSTYNYKDISNQESLNLSSGFVKIDEKRDSKNEDWQPVLGEKSSIKIIIMNLRLL